MLNRFQVFNQILGLLVIEPEPEDRVVMLDNIIQRCKPPVVVEAPGCVGPKPLEGRRAVALVRRLAQVPGLGIDSAQQVISEVGPTAATFSSAAEFASWVGTCPGKEESAEENRTSRSAKGNKYMRRILNQAAHAAARSKGTSFQAVFRRLRPRLGYRSAIWVIAHLHCRLVWKILHEG